jgi:hypothetical protein
MRKLNSTELNEFAHGVRIQRKAKGLTQASLYGKARQLGATRSPKTFARAETAPGQYSAYRDPRNRIAVVNALRVTEESLIRIGHEYIRDHGCYPCEVHPRSTDCRAH